MKRLLCFVFLGALFFVNSVNVFADELIVPFSYTVPSALQQPPVTYNNITYNNLFVEDYGNGNNSVFYINFETWYPRFVCMNEPCESGNASFGTYSSGYIASSCVSNGSCTSPYQYGPAPISWPFSRIGFLSAPIYKTDFVTIYREADSKSLSNCFQLPHTYNGHVYTNAIEDTYTRTNDGHLIRATYYYNPNPNMIYYFSGEYGGELVLSTVNSYVNYYKDLTDNSEVIINEVWNVGSIGSYGIDFAVNNDNWQPSPMDTSKLYTTQNIVVGSFSFPANCASTPSIPGNLVVFPAFNNFGNLTVGACSAIPTIFTLSNTGNSNINVTDITTNLTVSNNKVFELIYDWGTKPCNQSNPTITPSDNCTVGVAFCPATAGSVTDNLVITSNDPNSPANIQITGTGISTNGHLPITPVPSVGIGNPALDYGVSVSWATLPHNGIDYSSNLNDEVRSVGTGIVHRYTKATASRFGSISPDGRGPAIWVRYKLVSGEPVYVLYGHTATTWSDASTVVQKRFNFNCSYNIKWSPGNRISTGEAVGFSAPFYHSGVHKEHLHLSVFKPNRKKDGSYYEPPSSGWGYSNLNVREGNYINPKDFFNSYYLSDDI